MFKVRSFGYGRYGDTLRFLQLLWWLVLVICGVPVLCLSMALLGMVATYLLVPVVWFLVCVATPIYLIAMTVRGLQLRRMAKAVRFDYRMKSQSLWVDHSGWTKADWRLEAAL